MNAAIKAIKALFLANPPGELGPSDEPESVHRLGYNSALEDAIAAIEKVQLQRQDVRLPADGDSEETRAAFRDYDERESVSRRSHWQIWRDAIAWAATRGLVEPLTVKEISEALNRDSFLQPIAESRIKNPYWFQAVEIGVRIAEQRGTFAAKPVAWATTYECPPKTTVRLLADMNERQRAYVMQHAQKVVALVPGQVLKERAPTVTQLVTLGGTL